MELDKMTVPQLRDEVRRVFTYEVDTKVFEIPTGLSKMRKAELIDLLTSYPATTVEREQDNAAAEAFADNMLAGAIVAAADSVEFTPEERRELNEAKYRGRYEGKTVRLVTGHDRVHGVNVPRVTDAQVVDRIHRDSDPLNRDVGSGLLVLVVRHAIDAGHPRVTTLRAEDAVLSN